MKHRENVLDLQPGERVTWVTIHSAGPTFIEVTNRGVLISVNDICAIQKDGHLKNDLRYVSIGNVEREAA